MPSFLSRDAVMNVGERTKEMRALDLSTEPELAALAQDVEVALG